PRGQGDRRRVGGRLVGGRRRRGRRGRRGPRGSSRAASRTADASVVTMAARRGIRFYSAGDEYGEFSNFAPYPITLAGKRWPTSEHYFQAQKFDDPKQREKIRKANTPMIAARLGRDRSAKLRGNWESIKVQVMTEAVLAKFSQHEDLRTLLLATD